MQERRWYYIWQNQQVGPVPVQELQRLLGASQLPADTPVWTEGMPQWQPAMRLPIFQQPAAATQYPVQPMQQPVQPMQQPVQPMQQPVQPMQQPVQPMQQPIQQQAAALQQPISGAAGGDPLTPSERVLLTDTTSKTMQLAQLVYAAALLANNQAGVLRLSTQEKKGLFGKKTLLVAEPGPQIPVWPPSSIEFRMRLLADKGTTEVRHMVRSLLSRDVDNPEGWALDIVREGMVARGLIQVEVVRQALIFSKKIYHVVPEVQAMARANQSHQQLLGEAQGRWPDLWQILLTAIKQGINDRQQMDSTV